jgi:hypothetical protein
VTVNLASGTVLAKHAAQDTHAANPHHLGGQTSLTGTLTTSGTSVATLALGLEMAAHTRTRVNSLRLAHDVTVLDELAHVLACILETER